MNKEEDGDWVVSPVETILIETSAHLIKNHCPLWYRPEESTV